MSGRNPVKCALAVCCIACANVSVAQQLSFSNHRDIDVPDYAFLRIGPFYSNVSLSQEAGYRYTTSSGTGTDFLFSSHRGRIKKDGSDYPLITSLQFRNYLFLTRNIDVDFSARVVGEHYPNETQENALYVDLAEEGVEGNLSSEIALSPFLKLLLYDKSSYRTDYLDTRGMEDERGGSEYEHFDNTVGLVMDWLMDETRNINAEFSREDVVPMVDEFEAQERTSWLSGIAYEQKPSMFMTVGIRGDYILHEYTSSNHSDISFYDFSVFTGIQLTQRTTGRAAAGYSQGSVLSDPIPGAEESEDVGVMIGVLSLETKLSEEMIHSAGFERSQLGGYNSSFEVWNKFFYKFGWQGEYSSLTLETEHNSVEPSGINENDYTDWVNSISARHAVNRFCAVGLSTSYSMRMNKPGVASGDEIRDLEWNNDFDTWLIRADTTVALTKKIDFVVYYQHADRMSDADNLAYKRDTFETKLIYRHDF